MSAVAITGASGFIGRALLASFEQETSAEVRLLAHRQSAPRAGGGLAPTVVQGDLLNAATLRALPSPGGTVVHLAYLSTPQPEADNLAAARNLTAACRDARIRRLVYCSTAAVAGTVRADFVNEATPCHPGNPYEAAKLGAERLVREVLVDGIDVAILRPTAVFGPGGANLVKLAHALLLGNRTVNYVRSCVQGRRRMNLVHVDNVVASLRLLIAAPQPIGGGIYIASDDESPLNNYRDVEERLMEGLGLPPYPVPPAALPPALLSLLLRTAGRSATRPQRIYDGSKLLEAGLHKPTPFEQGIAAFARWYRSVALSAEARPQ